MLPLQRCLPVVLGLQVVLGHALAQNEITRRDYATPGLSISAGGRTGACDVLLFTRDGSQLLAAGDDKLIRTWKVDGPALALSGEHDLRWASWQDKRGRVFAMALSPDDRHVAIGGEGMNAGAVAVLKRSDGSVEHGQLGRSEFNDRKIWSMTYAPSGNKIAYGTDHGHVCVWQLSPADYYPRQLKGRHDMKGPDGKDRYFNRVRLVKFLSETELLSVSETGQVLLWNLASASAPPREVLRFEGQSVEAVAISPDKQWLAAAHGGASKVELRQRTGGGKPVYVEQEKDVIRPAKSIAFNADSRKLAVGYWKVDASKDYPREADFSVMVYDVPAASKAPGTLKGRLVGKPTYHPEALAFHPKLPILAVAGGENHEVTLWDHTKEGKHGPVLQSPGRCIWSVALTANNQYLAFQAKREPDFKHINQRGQGAWRVFDLHNLRWSTTSEAKFTPPPAPSRDGVAGWKVHTTHPDWKASLPSAHEFRKAIDRWWLTGPGLSKPALLPWNAEDGLPRCYALLEASAGRPYPRLIVGHAFGASVYDLVAGQGPKRTLILKGHDGEVMALAVSKDQKRLVTAGRDQTVAGWSLEPWPTHPTFGARIVQVNNGLMVEEVDAGSPAWELGLTARDRIDYVSDDQTDPKDPKKCLYDRNGARNRAEDQKRALDYLQSPVPGRMIFMKWTPVGHTGEPLWHNTTLPQRPLFRFFPAGQEWVLWRWRDHEYACSTQGDTLIGWQLNHWEKQKKESKERDVMLKPDFFRADQMKEVYFKPNNIVKMLKQWSLKPEPVKLAEIAPPVVTVQAAGNVKTTTEGRILVKDANLTISLAARNVKVAPNPGAKELTNQTITRAILWINDYRYKEWNLLKDSLPKTLDVPRNKLRHGYNEIVLQCVNHGNARGESKPLALEYEGAQVQPTLRGLFVGVGDYTGAVPQLNNLRANEDARDLVRIWKKQKGKLYKDVIILDPMVDEQASKGKVLQALKKLADDPSLLPDDVLVFYLGGHGARPQDMVKLRELLKIPERKDLDGLSPYLFVCSDFDIKKPRDTTISFKELSGALSKIPCRKLLLMDTCHAGGIDKVGVESNPIRELTPEGVGPVILMACQPHQSALEHPLIDKKQRVSGLFLVALAMTLDEEAGLADTNNDQKLVPTEVEASIARLVPKLVNDLGQQGTKVASKLEQNPVAFIPRMEKLVPIAGR